MLPPGDLPNPGFEPRSLSLVSTALAGGFFTTSATWEAPIVVQLYEYIKKKKRYFSYGTVDKNPPANAGDIVFILVWGDATCCGQLSPCTTTAEALVP